ncbi:MAG TPA: neutral zinc metallopeptidase [Iamia sp.]|jgi:predicted metalloprotease|nr:neutral zinc metallopeptidase [Iamia sp.]
MRFGRGADATSNVQDRRTGGRVSAFPGGARGVGGVGGLAGVVLAIVIAVVAQGGGGGGTDLSDIIAAGFPEAAPAPSGADGAATVTADADLRDFVAQVFNDTQDFWATTFQEAGEGYSEATLVLFDTPVDSQCGGARAEIGPHYCPPDETVFIELGFMRQLGQDFDAPGDFAQAYVVAHEMGHHVQKLLGTSSDVSGRSEDERIGDDGLSVRLELQADCYAGVWAQTVYDRGLLDPGDIEEALAAAAGVGDDRIQRDATGRVDRDSWTHGSSEQRQRWFRQGFDSGAADSCDTFSGSL